MYGFLRTPKWVAGVALALAGTVAFVSLGLWQLRRLDERRALNAEIAAGIAAELVPLDEVESGDRYRHVTVTGTYMPAEEVVLAGRTRDGRPGNHVVTPLVTAAGTAVLVDRGWVPLDVAMAGVPVGAAAPPAGEVTVTGYVRDVTRGEPSGEPVTTVREIDVGRLAGQVSAPLLPLAVQLERQDPAQPDLPLPAALPVIGEGSHLSYAVQWFLFAGVVAIGFPLLVRRTAQDRGLSPEVPDRAPQATHPG